MKTLLAAALASTFASPAHAGLPPYATEKSLLAFELGVSNVRRAKPAPRAPQPASRPVLIPTPAIEACGTCFTTQSPSK